MLTEMGRFRPILARSTGKTGPRAGNKARKRLFTEQRTIRQGEDTPMKRFLLLAAAIFGWAAIYAAQPSIAQDGWTTILDGKSMDNWDQLGGSNWHVTIASITSKSLLPMNGRCPVVSS